MDSPSKSTSTEGTMSYSIALTPEERKELMAEKEHGREKRRRRRFNKMKSKKKTFGCGKRKAFHNRAMTRR